MITFLYCCLILVLWLIIDLLVDVTKKLKKCRTDIDNLEAAVKEALAKKN